MIVLDASTVVEWLLGLPLAPSIERHLLAHSEQWHAPHLLAVEVAQVVRRWVARGDLDASRGADALADLADLRVHRHRHEPLLSTMWELRANLTAYDASYVALALALDAPLLTLDARLAAAPHAARIELVT